MSTPDHSQAQLRPRHFKPYHQESCKRNCNHKWVIIPLICTTSFILSFTIARTTGPLHFMCVMFLGPIISRPSFWNSTAASIKCMRTLWSISSPPHKSPLPSSSSPRRVSPWCFAFSAASSSISPALAHTPWVASAPASADQVTRLNSAYTDKWCDFHWTLKVRWCSWECISRNWKSLINEIYGYCYLLFAFVLCLVLCFSYPIMSTCAWAEHAGHHFIYLIAISMQRSSNRSENLLY